MSISTLAYFHSGQLRQRYINELDAGNPVMLWTRTRLASVSSSSSPERRPWPKPAEYSSPTSTCAAASCSRMPTR